MLSIIIPTYNESSQIAETIGKTIAALATVAAEIIVVDGGSSDRTMEIAMETGVIAVLSDRKGRAAQMNFGASRSKGEILYFLHADSKPPFDFGTQILKA